jgi:hypothetical protein
MFLGLHPTKRFSNPLSHSWTRLLYVASPFLSKPEEFRFRYHKAATEGESQSTIQQLHQEAMEDAGLEKNQETQQLKPNRRVIGTLEAYFEYHKFVRLVLDSYGSFIKDNFNVIFINGASVAEPIKQEYGDDISYYAIPNNPKYGTKQLTSFFSDTNLLSKRIRESETELEAIVIREGAYNFISRSRKQNLYVPVKHVIEAFCVENDMPKLYFDQEFMVPGFVGLNPVEATNNLMETLGKKGLGTTEKTQVPEFVSEFSRGRQELFDSDKAYKMLSDNHEGSLDDLRSQIGMVCAYNRFILAEMMRYFVSALVDKELNYFGTLTGYGYNVMLAAAKREGKKVHPWPIFGAMRIYAGGEAEESPGNKLTNKIASLSLGNRTSAKIEDIFDEPTRERFEGI